MPFRNATMKKTTYFTKQAGAALITSLIFLSVLTILGMSTLGTALLESRMAGNARDRNMAFQAAEIGLRDAERYIRDSGRINGTNEVGYDTITSCLPATEKCDAQKCLYGLCYNGGTMQEDGDNWVTDSVWQEDSFWTNAIQYQRANATGSNKGIGYASVSVPFSGAYTLPAALPLVMRQPEYLIEAFQKSVDGSNRYFYRITVRGYGVRTGTRVLLQEVYSPN